MMNKRENYYLVIGERLGLLAAGTGFMLINEYDSPANLKLIGL